MMKLFFFLLIHVVLCTPLLSQPDPSKLELLRLNRDNIFRRTGVHIDYGSFDADQYKSTESDRVRYQLPTDIDDVMTYMKLLSGELYKYPTGFFQTVKIMSINLSGGIYTDGKRERSAYPAISDRALILDIYGGGPHNILSNHPDAIGIRNQYLVHAVHHEMWHIIEAAFNSGRTRNEMWDWWGLNPPGTRYGAGGETMLGDNNKGGAGRVSNDIRGFLNVYATSAEEEDRAEIYSFLLHDYMRSSFESVCDQDPYLRKKVAHMIYMLGQYFYDPRKGYTVWEMKNNKYYRNKYTTIKFNADSYTGQLNEKGQRHGYGMHTWEDGRRFYGSFENNKFHGGGVYQTKNGKIIKGRWDNNYFVKGSNY